MYTLENYHWGLVAYYLGVLLIMIPTWRLTRLVPWFPLRWLLRTIFIAVLVTPMIVYRGMDFLAPAWGVAIFELIYPQADASWQRGIEPIVFIGAVLYALVLGVWLLRRRRQGKQPGAGQSARQEPTVSQKSTVSQEPTLSEILQATKESSEPATTAATLKSE